jgi:hypothetical protein
MRARSSLSPRIPTTRASSNSRPVTRNRSRTSAPAARAACTRKLSSAVRRGPIAKSTPSMGGGVPEISNAPLCNLPRRTGGAPSEQMPSRSPHRFARASPACQMKCVDTVSLGNLALSTTSTRYPRRASSIARVDPAQRAPTMMTSNIRDILKPRSKPAVMVAENRQGARSAATLTALRAPSRRRPLYLRRVSGRMRFWADL